MSRTYTTEQHEALSRIADFDHIFCVDVHGNVFEPSYTGYWAPQAYDIDSHATAIEWGNEEWQLPLSGLTGQHGYDGPWLHDSEQIQGGVAEHVLAMPGYWVAIYAQHSPECEHVVPTDGPDCTCTDDAETTIEGWTMAHIPFPQPFTNTARSAA